MAYLSDFRDILTVFGQRRMNMAIAVMAEIVEHEIAYPLTDKMKALIEGSKHGHPADRPLYGLLLEALNNTTKERCVDYAYLVNEYINGNWHVIKS